MLNVLALYRLAFGIPPVFQSEVEPSSRPHRLFSEDTDSRGGIVAAPNHHGSTDIHYGPVRPVAVARHIHERVVILSGSKGEERGDIWEVLQAEPLPR